MTRTGEALATMQAQVSRTAPAADVRLLQDQGVHKIHETEPQFQCARTADMLLHQECQK